MSDSPNWSDVEDVIARAEATGAILGVAISSPGGARFSHHGGRGFAAASTVKIAIMIELFRQIDAGRLSLEQHRLYRAEDKTNGSGVIMHLRPGLNFTLYDLAYLMMSISDNAATNMLIDLVGMEAVNATMRAMGMVKSVLGHKMAGRPALACEIENWAVPDEYLAMMSLILAGEAASAESCAQMVALLETQQNNRRIGRFLKRPEGPRWGSKTGSLPGVVNDVGFVMTEAGPLCLAVFCEGVEALAGEEMIGLIAQAALRV